MTISVKSGKKGLLEVGPKFIIRSSKDLMIRGGDFYAIWDDEKGLWSTDEDDVQRLIDRELDLYLVEHPEYVGARMLYMWDADSGTADKWHKYVQKQLRDKYHSLDDKLIFSNSPTRKEDYASKRLPYALEEGSIEAWDELVGTLYSPQERHKIEWAIGSIVSGDSREIQKFVVFYGEGGTGKSTILNVIQKLFDGYCATFNAKALGSGTDAFALEPFKMNPLVAIQHDGDLSRIEDNTRLNSLVSHEEMTVNEKFKSQYTNRFHSMLFMGTNRPVKITDSRSGVIRRLIDVSPTGKKIPRKRYDILMKKINFELGAIAWHCLQVYEEDKSFYDNYIPQSMIGASNDFYNFVEENFDIFFNENSTTLGWAWEKYKKYCDEANITYPYKKYIFKEELKNYFESFTERDRINGEQVRNYYSGFRSEKFGFAEQNDEEHLKIVAKEKTWLKLVDAKELGGSLIDRELASCPAQYAIGEGSERPSHKWEDVKTTLMDLDTSKVHYVRPGEQHIVIDFDMKDKKGEKSLEKNIAAAKSWPQTYAEISKGGNGLHLHYIYLGDVSKLSRIYDEDIEIKVFNGLSSLRRKLTKCNDIPIAVINSGLPLKGEANVVNYNSIKSERGLRKMIIRNLRKEIHDSTAPSVDFIYKILEDAYNSGLHYDVSDMRDDILAFASSSTHQSQKCIRTVGKMRFKSDEPSVADEYGDDAPLAFFDVEIFPNLFVLCYKIDGEPVIGMVNPESSDIAKLCQYKLVGFNNRKYDNHILYARIQGYTIPQLYGLSQKLINGNKNSMFGEAYNLSYTDIYDFASKKQSLKKWEIELGIHHQELGLPWDQDVPEDMVDKVVEYCKNDVVATEAVFHSPSISADFVAREILADIAGMDVNATTNQLTTRIIFGDDKNPQSEFVYTDLRKLFPGYEFNPYGIDKSRYEGTIKTGKSIYRGEDPSEGGRVYAEPGMYFNVALLDVASMHPSSIENLNLFGPYTKNFSDIKQARVYIKHKDYDSAKKLFDGKLSKYLDDEGMAKSLSGALKIAINSVYGLTSASFDNKFKDPRNVDNIVAKRGALFMIELQKTLQAKGYSVAHVKTDSIKIPEADQEIIDFVMEFGKKYGYVFEHEATYERLCLVNDAVYIAKDKSDGHWTATGAQFQVPYVFKTLFSHEPIEFNDMCETKSVTTALYLDFNEGLGEDEHNYQFIGKVGLFCPMKDGVGGGILLREKDGKYNAVTGTKKPGKAGSYRWMEAEMVKNLGLEDYIDHSYYDALVDAAKETIEKFGDFEMFVSDEPISELPF